MRERKKPDNPSEKYQAFLESINEVFCIIKVLLDENDHPVDYRFLKVNAAIENKQV